MRRLEPVLGAGPHLRGVAKLEDASVPVIDPAVRLGLPKAPISTDAFLIFTAVQTADQSSLVGLIAATLPEVVYIDGNLIRPVPSDNPLTGYAVGTTEAEGRTRYLIDIDRFVDLPSLYGSSLLAN